MAKSTPISWRTSLVLSTFFLVTCLPYVISALDDYVIEIAAMVDQSGFDKWKARTGSDSWDDLKKEIAGLIKKADGTFNSLRSMTPPLSISLKLTDQLLLTDSMFKFTKGFKKPDWVLPEGKEDFGPWLVKNYHKKYDMVILFTGLNVVNTYSMEGIRYAWWDFYSEYKAGICKKESFQFIELENALSPRIAMITFRNLLQRFRCDFRGWARDIKKEPVDPVPFSKCIHETLVWQFKDVETWKCLVEDFQLKIPAINETADDVCRGSYQMRRAAYKDGYGDKFCSTFECIKYNEYFKEIRVYELYGSVNDQIPSLRHKSKYPAPGLKCGRNKVCYGGKCVKTLRGDPNVSDSCPWGDQDLLALKYNQSCQHPNACQRFKAECCATCQGK